jgi:hypothetical protein
MKTVYDSYLSELRHPTHKTWILMSPSSIGETSVLCSLLEAFKQVHSLPITLVVPSHHEFIVRAFDPPIDKLILSDVESMRQLATSSLIPRGMFAPDYPINTWANQINDTDPLRLYNLWIQSEGTRGLDFINLYRYNLRIGWESHVAFPKISNDWTVTAERLLAELGVSTPFSIIHAGNNTNLPIRKSLLGSIVEKLHKEKRQILINEGGATFKSDRLSFDFIKYVDLPVDAAVCLTLLAESTIMGANGLSTFLGALPGELNLHVITPTHTLDGHGLGPGDIHFRKIVNRFEGSSFSSVRELINPINQYFEWSVNDCADHDEAVAEAIFSNQTLQGICISNRS